MDNRTTDELVRIALAGGGFELDAARRTTDDLVRIALAAGNKPARLRLVNVMTRTTDELTRIALAGKGAVFFVS
jgi:hypothetical protein